jgi:hypothetical protein
MVSAGKGRSHAGAPPVIKSGQAAGLLRARSQCIFTGLRGRHLIERDAMTDAKNDAKHDAKTESPHVAARQTRLREALRANLKRRKVQSRGRADQPTEPVEAGGSASDANNTRSDRMDQDGHD